MTEVSAPPSDGRPGQDPTAGTTIVLAIVIVAVVALVAAALALRDRGPGAQLVASPPATPAPTGPLRVERVAHQPGDCLTWDQDAPPPVPTPTPPAKSMAVVPCDQPHLVEVSGRVEITDQLDHVPTDAELDDLTDRLCEPVNAAHLGGPLDPYGRYYPAGIQPSPESWQAGDREVWCALGAHDGTDVAPDAGRHRPFTGPVAAADQFWRYEAGTCLTGGRRAGVACTEPHDVEVVGSVDLPEDATVPPTGDQVGWEALVGDACRAEARRYLGRDPEPPLTVGWLGIEPASWSAGQRTAHCVVGTTTPAGGWSELTGSARSLPS